MFLSYLVSVLYFAALSTQSSKICKEDFGHESCNLLPDDSKCGYPDAYKATSRIIGGHEAERSSYPWIACLQKDGENRCFCGGSLISQDYVLTAAHCVYNKTSPISVVLGEHDLRTDPDCSKTTGECSPPTQRLMVETMFIHEKYHKFRHDIALLKLLTPANLNRYVLPICLPFTVFDNTDNIRVISAGWGRRIDNGTSSRRYDLQETELRTATKDECNATITDEHICVRINAPVPINGVTPGDSGGPLMTYKLFDEWRKRFYLLGITSFTSKIENQFYKSIFTRVSSYIHWILDHMYSVN